MVSDCKNMELYPSAVLLQEACYKDYKDLLERHSRIYDRVNIALGVCGVVLFAILDSLDYEGFLEIKQRCKEIGWLLATLPVALSAVSAAFLIWSLIELLCLLRGKTSRVFDSIPIRNNEIYRAPNDQAALLLICCYTNAIDNLKKVTAKKQKRFNRVITLLVVAIICHAVASMF